MRNRNKQTKFPVARIKKIMQKDEEVGKVAQATPVVISKALELFLALLVQEAADVTSGRNSKRVEAYHLKHAIERTDMLDFLKEIVSAVPDPSAGGTIDLDAERNAARNADGGAAGKRKRGTGAPRKRRRKGAAAEEDEGQEDGGGGGGGGRGGGAHSEEEYDDAEGQTKEEDMDDTDGDWGE